MHNYREEKGKNLLQIKPEYPPLIFISWYGPFVGFADFYINSIYISIHTEKSILFQAEKACQHNPI